MPSSRTKRLVRAGLTVYVPPTHCTSSPAEGGLRARFEAARGERPLVVELEVPLVGRLHDEVAGDLVHGRGADVEVGLPVEEGVVVLVPVPRVAGLGREEVVLAERAAEAE